MVKAILEKESDQLFNIFSIIDYEESIKELADDYNFKLISVFDHQLSENEFIRQEVTHYDKSLVNYPAVLKKYKNYEESFLNFYSDLYDNTKVYGRLFSYRASGSYISFDSRDEYLSHVLLSIREYLFLEIMLPEYHTIIDGGYDLTHTLMIKQKYSQGLEKINKIVQKHNLYIIDQ